MTGGEPLLQHTTPDLVEALNVDGYRVSIETHGAAALDRVIGRARLVMDIKTPDSGMFREIMLENALRLTPTDELKFVIASRADFEWAHLQVKKLRDNPDFRSPEILFSPAGLSANAPGGAHAKHITPTELADWILESRLDVRFQLQLHKTLWGRDTIGV